ncbi:MAG: hypothetical protein Q9M39_07825 [Sulfurovum sp.]|nr:hypothetical protein [Sulfurovum sp.]
MRTEIENTIKRRLMNSYIQGIGKAMDANNEIRVFHRCRKSTIYTAWEDVGKDLSNAILEYEEKEGSTSDAK